MEFYTKQRCSFCATLLTIHQKVRGGVCDNQDCKRKKALDDDKRLREEKDKQLKQQVDELYQKLRSKTGIDNALIAILPANTMGQRPLPKSRKEEMMQHLNSIADELATVDVQTLDRSIENRSSECIELSEGERDLLGKACATCRGYCCVTVGKKNAFLDVKILRRYWRENPNLTIHELVNLYASYIAPESVENSCLFHGERGCRLPRDMRAYICNEYLCPSLITLRNDLEKSKTQNAFGAATQGQQIVRTAYFDTEQLVEMG